MKIVSAALIGLLAATILAPASAGAANESAGVTTAPNTEFSASKKYRHAYWPAHIVPSHDFVGPYGYPGEYAMRRAYGQCVLDLGYGRWRAC